MLAFDLLNFLLAFLFVLILLLLITVFSQVDGIEKVEEGLFFDSLGFSLFGLFIFLFADFDCDVLAVLPVN